MMSWIGNIRFKPKLIAIVVAGLVPTVLVSVVCFRAERAQIRAYADEISGLSAFVTMESLLAPLAEHEVWAAAGAAGDPSGKAKVAQAASTFEQAMAGHGEHSADYGAPTGEDERRWQNVKEAWQRLAQEHPNSVKATQSQHNELRDLIFTYRDYLVSTSGLIFDSNPANYFVLHASTVDIPDFNRYSAELRTAAAAIGANGSATSALTADVVRAEVLAESALDAVAADLSNAAQHGEKGGALQSEGGAALKDLRVAFMGFRKYIDENVTSGSISSPVDEILEQSAQVAPAADRLHGVMLTAARTGLDDVYADARATRLQLILVVLVALGLCLTFTVLVATHTIGGLKDAVSIVHGLAEGDYTRTLDVQGRDEHAQMLVSLLSMQDKVASVLREVKDNAGAVSTAADEILSGTQDLSRRTEQQAASLEETSSTMEEMAATVSQNANNAQLASQLAAGARDEAVLGGQVAKQAIEAMSTINASSNKIAEIISVIDAIAFQTNLLSLNAAVEAARAGEQGRGFAIVASEVRSLAHRSSTAAKEIKDLIKASVASVGQGSKLVSDTGRHLEDIVSSVRKVSDLVGEIATATQEQAVSAVQINRSVTQMDEGTQQNAAMVEQASASASRLNGLAKKLNQLTTYFKLDESSEATSEAAVYRAAATTPAKKRAASPTRSAAIREPAGRVRSA
jgi:methyl-accepting chemotaxis protein